MEAPDKRRRDDSLNPRNRYVYLYIEIIVTVISQVEITFQDLSELQFFEPPGASKQFQISSYGSIFNFGSLWSDLMSVYRLFKLK